MMCLYFTSYFHLQLLEGCNRFLTNFLCLTLAAFSKVFALRLQAAGKYLPLGVVTFDMSFTSFHFLFLKLDHYHSGFLVCLNFLLLKHA